jgi:hypothetical protein
MPNKYGVWNNTSEMHWSTSTSCLSGRAERFGVRYAAINTVLNEAIEELDVDLWISTPSGDTYLSIRTRSTNLSNHRQSLMALLHTLRLASP